MGCGCDKKVKKPVLNIVGISNNTIKLQANVPAKPVKKQATPLKKNVIPFI